jgi:hypothetical protein
LIMPFGTLADVHMALPSHISQYDTVPLLDLDQVDYLIACRPRNASLRAWTKLEETERRWTMFDWGTFVVHDGGRCTLMMQDFASAYLLSFEATLQVLKDEKFASGFEQWLATQAAYDLECRGLRTLRHLEAHVRAGALSAKWNAKASSRFAGPSLGGTIAWYWSEITAADLGTLKHAKLQPAELPAWNDRSAKLLVLGLMRHGLYALTSLLNSAGP